MDLRVEESTIYSFPHAFINKRGEAILIQALDDKRCQQLTEMYLDYQPRNSFQGLPPIQDEACVNWVQHMMCTGINLVALSFGEGVVGHVVLFPVDNERCELLAVVSPPFQHTGIGTELTRNCIQLAYELGFESIWLSVEQTNVIARHVYKKCGFEYLSDKQAQELEMSLDLRRRRDAFAVSVARIMTRDVISVRLNESCRTALRTFINQPVATLPVVDDHEQLVGIISETDLMLPSNMDRKVSDVFTREVVTVREGSSISKAIRLFRSKKIRCIPVVNGEKKVVGIVGRKDILSYYEKNL